MTSTIGLEIEGNGHPIGVSPDDLSKDDFAALGHEQSPILKVIRAKCLDCCGEVPSEVRKCTSRRCSLWPYRMGSNPIRDKRELSDEQRDVLRERMARARAAS